MKINTLLILFCIAAVAGCGKKDVLLIDQVQGEFIVNPETKILIKENQLIEVQYDGTTIKGLTKTHVFQTTNEFKNFSVTPHALDLNNNFRESSGNWMFSSPKAAVPSFITYTADYGNTWNTINPTIIGFPTAGFFANMIISELPVDNSTMLLTTVKSETDIMVPHTVNSTWFYHINLNTGQGNLLSSIPDYSAYSVHFIDKNNGWLNLNKVLPVAGGGYSNRNCFVAKTTDGGLSWSTPLMVAPDEPFNMAVGKTGNLFAYTGNGDAYFSANGSSWTKCPVQHRFTNVAIASAAVLYAVAEEGILKSTDGGLTWTVIKEYFYGKLVFVNELDGILYGEQTLYITKDGGLSWKTLLFPYPYIIS